VERAAALLRAPGGSVFLYDAARNDLEILVARSPGLAVGARFAMGEGMAGRVATTRQPLLVNDYQHWEHRSPQMADVPIAGSIQVPMLYAGELIGVLAVNDDNPRHEFNHDDARLLSLFASHAASALHNARLLDETRRRATQLGLLYDAGLALNSVLEPHAQIEFLF